MSWWVLVRFAHADLLYTDGKPYLSIAGIPSLPGCCRSVGITHVARVFQVGSRWATGLPRPSSQFKGIPNPPVHGYLDSESIHPPDANCLPYCLKVALGGLCAILGMSPDRLAGRAYAVKRVSAMHVTWHFNLLVDLVNLLASVMGLNNSIAISVHIAHHIALLSSSSLLLPCGTSIPPYLGSTARNDWPRTHESCGMVISRFGLQVLKTSTAPLKE